MIIPPLTWKEGRRVYRSSCAQPKMEKKRQHQEETPTEGSKKICKEGMRAKDKEPVFFGNQPAPAFKFSREPAFFGSQPAPAFNSESFGAGFKARFESGFEAGFEAGNNQAKPAFSYGVYSGAPSSLGISSSSLASLERYKQVSLIFLLPLITISLHVFKEEKTSSLLTPEGSRLLGQAEDLNIEANAALQAQLAKMNKNLNF